MDPYPRCDLEHPEYSDVFCDEPLGHPHDHGGRDSTGGRWCWPNLDED